MRGYYETGTKPKRRIKRPKANTKAKASIDPVEFNAIMELQAQHESTEAPETFNEACAAAVFEANVKAAFEARHAETPAQAPVLVVGHAPERAPVVSQWVEVHTPDGHVKRLEGEYTVESALAAAGLSLESSGVSIVKCRARATKAAA